MKFLLRWLVSAISILAAVILVPGIHIDGNAYIIVAVMAIILGLVNAVIRPILAILSCGLIIITLGLFTFVINALMLLLSAKIAELFNIGFTVDGFWPALWGSLVISIVSFLLSTLLKDDEKK